MRIAALTLGITAGVLGLGMVLVAVALSVTNPAALGESGGPLPAIIAITVGMACNLLGLTGAALIFVRPRLAGWLMIGAGIGFSLFFLFLALVSGPMFVAAGIFALKGRSVPIDNGKVLTVD